MARPVLLLAGGGHNADWFRAALGGCQIGACIPSKSRRTPRIPLDRQLCRKRHKIGNLSGKKKDRGRIHTRYDCDARTFMSAIAMATILIFWL